MKTSCLKKLVNPICLTLLCSVFIIGCSDDLVDELTTTNGSIEDNMDHTSKTENGNRRRYLAQLTTRRDGPGRKCAYLVTYTCNTRKRANWVKDKWNKKLYIDGLKRKFDSDKTCRLAHSSYSCNY